MKKDSHPIGNAHYINKLNKVKVLDLVRNNDNLSRAEIAKRSGLSAPTVSRIVDALLAEGLIREIGEGSSHGGRRPIMLRLAAEDNFIIGIDLGTTNIYGVITDLNARIIHELKSPTHVPEGFPRVMEITAAVIDDLMARMGRNVDRIQGIGMAVAGLINRERNIVEFSPNFNWHDVDILGVLGKKFRIPIIIDNVSRVMALGEMRYGLGRDHKNLICVNVGYGIGAGFIVNGRPLYGPMGMAGELGHIIMDIDSRVQCGCGNFGCLEALASGNAIARAAKTSLEAGESSLLLELCGGDTGLLTAEMIAHAAKQGDALAVRVFDRAAEYIGIALAGMVNIFNPEIVVIGGGVAQSGDILFEKVRKTVAARSLNKVSRDVLIRPATFGMKAAVMGAVALILGPVLNLDIDLSNGRNSGH